MKKENSDITPAENIDNLINRIKDSDINNISGIFLDESLMEFFSPENEIQIPPVPVSELDYATGLEITGKLIEVVPEYLSGHALLEKRKPASEQHSLHFIKMIPGRLVDFVHILRFDFKLAGGDGRITDRGSNRAFPQYGTDRIKYKSRLVPVVKGSDPYMIDSLRLKSQVKIEDGGSENMLKKVTAVFFDEFSTAEISIDFSTKAGKDIYSIPPKIYPFISYDYFTACLNIPDPGYVKLDNAAGIFEPLFLYLYFQYREGLYEIDTGQLNVWDEYLEVTESGVSQRAVFHQKLEKFFSAYTLFRDDELMLKGLRKFVIS